MGLRALSRILLRCAGPILFPLFLLMLPPGFVLAHVADTNGFVQGIARRPSGRCKAAIRVATIQMVVRR